jgi:hypothetical protein
MSTDSGKGVSRRAFYATIAVLLSIIGVITVFAFLSWWQPPIQPESKPESKPEPEITDISVAWDDYGRTCILYVSVKNTGASGNVKVFAQVNTGAFAQTQNERVYLDEGGAATLTFTFHSDWLANSTVSRNVWAIVP